MSEIPKDVFDAINANLPEIAKGFIDMSITEAKYAALNYRVEKIYSRVFPQSSIPEFKQSEDYTEALMKHMVDMTTHIRNARIDIANAIFEVSKEHGIDLESAVIAKRRSHLTVVSDNSSKMQDDSFDDDQD